MVLRQKGGIDKLFNPRYVLYAAGSMAQCDQPVGLTTAVGSIEPENRCNFTTRAGQPPAHIGKQVLEAPCGIGVGKETGRVQIRGISCADNDLCQIRREIRLGNRSLKHIRAGAACLEYRRDCHGFLSACFPGSSGLTAFAAVH